MPGPGLTYGPPLVSGQSLGCTCSSVPRPHAYGTTQQAQPVHSRSHVVIGCTRHHKGGRAPEGSSDKRPARGYWVKRHATIASSSESIEPGTDRPQKGGQAGPLVEDDPRQARRCWSRESGLQACSGALRINYRPLMMCGVVEPLVMCAGITAQMQANNTLMRLAR